MTRIHLHIGALALLLALSACASSGEHQNDEHQATEPASEASSHTHDAPHSGKLKAPLNLTLTSSGTTGEVKATLNITATADIPDARVRFKVPAGVTLLQGKGEQALGALKAQESRTIEVTVKVAPDKTLHAQLIAAVDCHMSPGLKLARSAMVDLGAGAPPADGSKVEDGVRVQTIKPRK